MTDQLLFLLLIESCGLLLALVLLLSYTQRQHTEYQKKIEAAVSNHFDNMFTSQIRLVQKDLEKIGQTILQDSEKILQKNHTELTAVAKEKITEFTTMLSTKTAEFMHEQKSQVVAEVHNYREQKIAALDKNSEKILNTILQKKVWHLLQFADQHAIAKTALQELLASGELNS